MRTSGPRWSLRGLMVFIACASLFLWGCNQFFVRPVRYAIDIERRVQAACLTIALVDRHVCSTAQWPKSWEELRAVSLRWPDFDWPEGVDEIKRLVEIDFSVDISELFARDSDFPQATRGAGIDSETVESHYQAMLQGWKDDGVVKLTSD